MACLLHTYSKICAGEPKWQKSTKLARKGTKSKRFIDKMSEREARYQIGNQYDEIDM